jgi:circadian clock protein KaiC
MAHSNQIREFFLSSDGIKLREAYIGPEGAFTGSAGLAQEAKEKTAERIRRQEIDRRSREADRKRREIQAQIAVLQGQLEENDILSRQEIEREDQLAADRNARASSRHVTPSPKSTAKMPGKPKPRLVRE